MGISSPNYELNSIRILHVDDEEFFLEASNVLLHTFLKKFNVDLTTLSTVDTALKFLENEDVDVIISDYQMPSIDGLEFLSHLREQNNNTPFIILTGRGREEVVIKALNLGADYYIQKGLDVNLLFTELAHYITVLFDKKRDKLRRMIAEEELQYRVNYEDIISDLSTHFINLAYQEIDNAISSSLKDIVSFEDYDCCSIIQLENNNLVMSFSLPEGEFNEKSVIKNAKENSYLINLIKDYYSLHIIHLDKINKNARKELESLGFKNFPSLLSIPLTEDENSFGMLLFGSKKINRHWSENNILFLRMVGEMISRALLKKRLEKEIESRDKNMKKFISSLQMENENQMKYILSINDNIKEFLTSKYQIQEQSNTNLIDLDNLIKDLRKDFPDVRIDSSNSLPTVYGNFDITYRCFKLLFQNIIFFKQTSIITFTWNVVNGVNELHISNNAFSIFFDIPNALNDLESARQYQTILEIKTLITLNKWVLEFKEYPDFVFIIKNIIIK